MLLDVVRAMMDHAETAGRKHAVAAALFLRRAFEHYDIETLLAGRERRA